MPTSRQNPQRSNGGLKGVTVADLVRSSPERDVPGAQNGSGRAGFASAMIARLRRLIRKRSS